MPIIVRDLHHVYNEGTPLETPSLRGVSLTIEDGEFVGLIGTMGAGKSTLVQHLNGLIKPPPGAVVVDGVDVGARGGDDLLGVRQRVGLVLQYPEQQLFAASVAADVAFGPRNLGLSDDEVAVRTREALIQVGLEYDEVKDRSPFALSGGQQRRVALAGVLAMRPRFLVLDEPTAGLDPKGRRELLDVVTRLHREQGVAVVLVTHHMEDVARLADKVVVLAGGRVAMTGTPGEVLSAERATALRDCGLEVPLVSQLIARLRDRGWSLPDGVVTEDAAVTAILRALGERTADATRDGDGSIRGDGCVAEPGRDDDGDEKNGGRGGGSRSVNGPASEAGFGSASAMAGR